MPDQQLQLSEKGGQLAAPRSLLEVVLRAASDPDVDADKLEKLLGIGRQLEADKAKREWTAAFFAAKKELDGITIRKNGAITSNKPGKDYNVKFAKYEDIAKVVKPILAKHDLSAAYTYEMHDNPPKTVCIMRLAHTGGHVEEFRSVPFPMLDQSGGKSDAQAAGSIATYARRYVVAPTFDIQIEDADDDGSGQGPAQHITEEQARRIEDIVTECNNRDPKSNFRVRFADWLQAEFGATSVAKLYQGRQLDAVMAKLREKQSALGVK